MKCNIGNHSPLLCPKLYIWTKQCSQIAHNNKWLCKIYHQWCIRHMSWEDGRELYMIRALSLKYDYNHFSQESSMAGAFIERQQFVGKGRVPGFIEQKYRAWQSIRWGVHWARKLGRSGKLATSHVSEVTSWVLLSYLLERYLGSATTPKNS